MALSRDYIQQVFSNRAEAYRDIAKQHQNEWIANSGSITPEQRLINAASSAVTAFVASGGNPVAAAMAAVQGGINSKNPLEAGIEGVKQGVMSNAMSGSGAGGSTPTEAITKTGGPAINTGTMQGDLSNLLPIGASVQSQQPSINTISAAPKSTDWFSDLMSKGGNTFQSMTNPSNMDKTALWLQSLGTGDSTSIMQAMNALKQKEEATKYERGIKQQESNIKSLSELNKLNEYTKKQKAIEDKQKGKQTQTNALEAAGKQEAAFLNKIGMANDVNALNVIAQQIMKDPSVNYDRKIKNGLLDSVNQRRKQLESEYRQDARTAKSDANTARREAAKDIKEEKINVSNEKYNTIESLVNNISIPETTYNTINKKSFFGGNKQEEVPVEPTKQDFNNKINKLKQARNLINSNQELNQSQKVQLKNKIDAKIKELNKAKSQFVF